MCVLLFNCLLSTHCHVDKFFRCEIFFVEVVAQLIDKFVGTGGAQFVGDVAALEAYQSVGHPVALLASDVFLNQRQQLVETHHSARHHIVEFLAAFAYVAVLEGHVGQTDSLGYGLRHPDFLANAVDEMEPALGVHDSQRNAREAAAGPHVEESSAGSGLKELRYGERMEYVVGIQVVDILAGDHVDFAVPVGIQRAKLLKLLVLLPAQAGKVFLYYTYAVHSISGVVWVAAGRRRRPSTHVFRCVKLAIPGECFDVFRHFFLSLHLQCMEATALPCSNPIDYSETTVTYHISLCIMAEVKENELNESASRGLNFVEQIVADDLNAGKNGGRLNTRFPPEPNGYLHIGHAKAICMDFGVAEKFGGTCNLRFDDTNPIKEDTEYVDAIREDIHWLGFDWGDREYYASDYFPQLFDLAVRMIKEGKAYVDDQTSEEIAAQKGTPTTPGTESPYRSRSVEENLDLFMRMNAGEFPEGARVLRAKIDMASSNMHFRDPIMYRIIKHPHHRTGTKWNVYPMYDFAHGQSDYFEGVTHSICTLEFVPHRPLYEYFVAELADESYCPRQIEFNRLNLTYTVMSKRKLLQLVKEGLVAGWDDPRMPTISGMRRRGFTARAIRNFIDRIGYTKIEEAMISVSLLEHAVREDLNAIATRAMAVIIPVKVVITNYPEGQTETVEMENNPEDPQAGTHSMPFSREIYIERDDFMENPPKKFFRLSPGSEVRLKGAYIIKCEDVKKDADGNITEIFCTYDPESRSGLPGASRKVKGTLHWVSAAHAKDATVRLYDRLFSVENPSAETDKDFRELLNPGSLVEVKGVKVEPFIAENAEKGRKFQFQRVGYFTPDYDSTPGNLIFNRTIALKDSWEKAQAKG